jgi:hypothetical protein
MADRATVPTAPKPFVLHAGYLDGANFHTFRATSFDAAAAYARNKGWAVGDYVPSEVGPGIIHVLPPLLATRDERRLVRLAQSRNPDVIIHPIDTARGTSWDD